jgi:hypothetical protein
MRNSPRRAIEIIIMLFWRNKDPESTGPLNVRPDWRRDLNCPTCGGESSFVNSAGRANVCVARFEHDLTAATPIRVTRKPFDVLAEGLISKNNRGDKTPLELFVASVRGWEAAVRRRMTDEMPAQLH